MKKNKLNESFFYEQFSRLGDMMEEKIEDGTVPSETEKYEGSLDEFLNEYMPQVGERICEEESKVPSCEMPEDMEKSVWAYGEKELKKEKRKQKCLCHGRKIAVIALFIIGLSLTATSIHSMMDPKTFIESSGDITVELITDENRHLVGKENSYGPEETFEGEIVFSEDSYFANSRIVSSIAHEILRPMCVTDIKTEHNRSPELLIRRNTCALLYKDSFSGWYCQKGDILCYEFSKYPLETGKEQKLAIGYVIDGTMYYKKVENAFYDMNGCYQVEIKEDGEYYLYLLNLDGDNLSLKQGTVSIKRSEDIK